MSESKVLGMMDQAAAKRQERPHIGTDGPVRAEPGKAGYRRRFAMAVESPSHNSGCTKPALHLGGLVLGFISTR